MTRGGPMYMVIRGYEVFSCVFGHKVVPQRASCVAGAALLVSSSRCRPCASNDRTLDLRVPPVGFFSRSSNA